MLFLCDTRGRTHNDALVTRSLRVLSVSSCEAVVIVAANGAPTVACFCFFAGFFLSGAESEREGRLVQLAVMCA